MVTKTDQRMRLLYALQDHQGTLWEGRPTYRDYIRARTFRDNVAGRTHSLFGARCWVCGVTAREAEYANNSLTTAHIVYPVEPWTEVIDPSNLSRSDVVLLCWACHLLFDRLTDGHFPTVEELRRYSVDVLDRMRVGRRTGEDLPVDEP
jgi:hypothetical protein